MRKSSLFFIYIAINIIFLFFMFTHASYRRNADTQLVAKKMEMVRRLELTDLCLFTEASYIRHLSQADVHTPFQDYPMSVEHFPSGSLLGPPPTIKKINAKLD
jgi:hypothetical protein